MTTVALVTYRNALCQEITDLTEPFEIDTEALKDLFFVDGSTAKTSLVSVRSQVEFLNRHIPPTSTYMVRPYTLLHVLD